MRIRYADLMPPRPRSDSDLGRARFRLIVQLEHFQKELIAVANIAQKDSFSSQLSFSDSWAEIRNRRPIDFRFIIPIIRESMQPPLGTETKIKERSDTVKKTAEGM